MSNLSHFLRSLVLTSIFSFLAPVLLIGAILSGLALLEYIPPFEMISRTGIEQVSSFLATFGSGSAIRGLVVIGTAVSVVGILFDAYTFYRYQNLRDN